MSVELLLPSGEKLLHVPSNTASSSKTYTAIGAINSGTWRRISYMA